jgi:hypothetical protein
MKELANISELVLGSSAVPKAFLRHYASVTGSGQREPDAVVIDIEHEPLASHAEILQCIRHLVGAPTISKDELLKTLPLYEETRIGETDRIARMIVSIAFMIDCASKDFHSESLASDDIHMVKWEESASFVDFKNNILRAPLGASLEETRKVNEGFRFKKSVKAWKLIKRYGIKISATDDLLQHLAYNPKLKSVKVFHHVGFLRAHLKRSASMSLDLSIEESIKL